MPALVGAPGILEVFEATGHFVFTEEITVLVFVAIGLLAVVVALREAVAAARLADIKIEVPPPAPDEY